ncbi:hypothetical protein [Massilia cavernae]|uniref:Uncharacterized protein n=1 Tax=Massilia cavernae TaxID=2320864 RepID=A0A418Y7E0_9BURK|nr:hypothetical protein [Massilia cavernae]RJG25883.1 hypothetical protein D3872_02475 [Massilia cavernae]
MKSDPLNGAPDGEAKPRFRPRPWIHLDTVQDVELWIDEHNRSLQENIGPQETGYGVCFTLAEGGNIYLHSAADAVLLDVDQDARWIAPLIVAATGAEDPGTDYWTLPDDKLIQLVIGLSCLVESTTLVVGHRFGSLHRKMGYG